jgi:hypothetical protein
VLERKADQAGVVAFRNIDMGEEITVSYLESIDLLSPDRREYIQTWYRFECGCRVCPPGNINVVRSDEIRQHVKSSFERWETFPIDEWYSSDLSAEDNKLRTLEVMDTLELEMKNEGLWAFLPRLFEYRFQLQAAWGDLEAAKAAGRQWKAEEINLENGISDERVEGVRTDPRRWEQWGKLRKLYGGKLSSKRIGRTVVAPRGRLGRKSAEGLL